MVFFGVLLMVAAVYGAVYLVVDAIEKNTRAVNRVNRSVREAHGLDKNQEG